MASNKYFTSLPKQKFCKECKKRFVPTRLLQQVCGYECAVSKAKKDRAFQLSKLAKEEKAVLKEKVKTLSQYEAEAKKSFQRYIRLRDSEYGCISCGTTETDLFDGGHFKKAEIYSGVIFNENNCHKQCRKCNRYLNGNELMYREGLVKRFGEQFVIEIEQLANDTRQMKFTKDFLISKKFQYDILYKELLNVKQKLKF